ncbi:MAG: serine aminopeptidase domain-containing protein [Acidimicrobiales bacterium]
MVLTTRALWFGPPERPLFGRAYVPEGGAAHGGVVLCPPFGLEAQGAGRAYRALGQRLSAQGLAVLHIDYDGTGDSAGGAGDPDRGPAWRGSVGAAVDLLRAGGAGKVFVVGMRLGATLAAGACAECAPDGLVLWDPCDSGRSYLREEALLRSVYLGDQGLDIPPAGAGAEAGAAEVLGTVYDAATVQALGKLALEACPTPPARHVLALLRPERPPKRAVREWLSAAGAEVAEAAGQEQVISVWPLKSVVPHATLDIIASWLAGVAGGETSEVVLPGSVSAVVGGPAGEEVVEEIRSLGPGRLFGIMARPPVPRGRATVVMLNSGRIDHVGPGRLWVDLARSWAAAGLEVLRADLSGLGDSPPRPGRPADVVYGPDAAEDVADIARAVSPEDPSAVVLMGLCSGAYHSVEAALATGARGVVAINLVPPSPPGDPPTRSPEAAPQDGRHRQRLGQALAALHRAGSRLPGHHYLGALGRRAADVKWWCAHRLGHGYVPAFALARLARSGVDTLVLSGSYEGRQVRQGEGWLLWRLGKRAGFDMVVLPTIDHTLFTQGARRQALPLVSERVKAQCAVRVVATISGPWPAPVEKVLPHEWGYWGFLRRLLRAAKGADAVILRGTSGFTSGYVEAVAALLIKLRWRHPPLVLVSDATWDVTSQALEERLPAFARRLLPRLGRWGVRATDGRHVVYGVLSSDEKRDFERRWGVDGSRVRFIPFYATLWRDLASTATDEGYLFAGGISYRDYDLLVKATEGLDIPVRVASSWRPSQPLPANVTVASLPQDEYNRALLGASLMVVPLRPAARSAGQATYLSAMLAGKPLIVTDAPGVRDYVVPGETALLVEPDPDALRAAITWVRDPANRAEVQLMVKRARQTVEEHYLARHYFSRLWYTATQEAAQRCEGQRSQGQRAEGQRAEARPGGPPPAIRQVIRRI